MAKPQKAPSDRGSAKHSDASQTQRSERPAALRGTRPVPPLAPPDAQIAVVVKAPLPSTAARLFHMCPQPPPVNIALWNDNSGHTTSPECCDPPAWHRGLSSLHWSPLSASRALHRPSYLRRPLTLQSLGHRRTRAHLGDLLLGLWDRTPFAFVVPGARGGGRGRCPYLYGRGQELQPREPVGIACCSVAAQTGARPARGTSWRAQSLHLLPYFHAG